MKLLLLIALRNLTRRKGHLLLLLCAIAFSAILVQLHTDALLPARARAENIGSFSFGFGFFRSQPIRRNQTLLGQVWSMAGSAILSSAFIVFSVLNLDVTRAARQLSRMRCLGFSRMQIASIALLQGAFSGLLGGLAGMLAGTLWLGMQFHRCILPSHETLLFTLSFSLISALAASVFPAWQASRVPPTAFIHPPFRPASAGKLLLFTLAGIAFLLLLPCCLYLEMPSPDFRLRLFATAGTAAFLCGLILTLPALLRLSESLFTPAIAWLLRIPAPLLRQLLTGNLTRSIILSIAIGAGLALCTAIRIWSESMLQMFRVPASTPKLLLRFQESFCSPELAEQVASLPLAECIPLTLAQPELAGPLREKANISGAMGANVVLMGMDTPAPIPLKSGSREHLRSQFQSQMEVCVIPETFARQCGLSIGDTIRLRASRLRPVPGSRLPSPASDGTVALTVAGITSFPWAWFSKCAGVRVSAPRTAALLFVPRQIPLRHFAAIPNEAFWLTPAPDVDAALLPETIDAFVEEAAQSIPRFKPSYAGGTRWDSGINSRHYLLHSTEELNQTLLHRSDNVISLMLKLPRICCLLSALVLFSATGVSLATRESEFRVLRACGVPSTELRRILLAEMVLLTLAAETAALSAGALFAFVCCRLADHAAVFGVAAPPLLFPWAKILPLLLTSFLTTLLAACAAIYARRLPASIAT